MDLTSDTTTLNLKFQKISPDAVIPHKVHDTDVGYDLTLIKLIAKDGNLYHYDTGIAVKPPDGYYTEVVARSSLPGKGYLLANSVGIIDPDYRGSIQVKLLKFDNDKPDLPLGMRYLQLIVRPVIASSYQIVDDLNSTSRGSGGFGSSGH